VDIGTGTLTMRAVLQNADRTLLPGYFVRVRIPAPRAGAPALLVPDAALGASQAGSYLMVVDNAGVVQQRGVRTGALDGTLRVIESGVGPDDQVVVSGLSRAIPGEKVVAKPAPVPAQ
jgi:RND family efflux transporter MFP subunit